LFYGAGREKFAMDCIVRVTVYYMASEILTVRIDSEMRESLDQIAAAYSERAAGF